SQIAFHDAVLQRLQTLPGMASAGFTSHLPFSGGNDQGSYQIDGYSPPAGQPQPHGMIRRVSPDFFRAMGIPLLRGRKFTAHDDRSAEPVVVIDRFLADRYWPNQDPIGKRISLGQTGSD